MNNPLYCWKFAKNLPYLISFVNFIILNLNILQWLFLWIMKPNFVLYWTLFFLVFSLIYFNFNSFRILIKYLITAFVRLQFHQKVLAKRGVCCQNKLSVITFKNPCMCNDSKLIEIYHVPNLISSSYILTNRKKNHLIKHPIRLRSLITCWNNPT